jgi:hypothetical protein
LLPADKFEHDDKFVEAKLQPAIIIVVMKWECVFVKGNLNVVVV